MNRSSTLLLACASAALASAAFAQPPRGGEAARLARLKTEAIATVDASQKQMQEIVDSLFSFSELAFQEFETQRYLTQLLESNGFTVETGVSGMPSSWWATWGSGEPVIALGSDIDGIPKASQTPGVAYREPLIDGAPGHGEGHNSGQAVNIVAALAVKEIMQRERLPGTIVVWPGVAEELLAAKAWFVRDGRFNGVDAVLFTHVGARFGTAWGHIDRHRARVGRVLVRRHRCAQRRDALARPQRARRRRAHEHRLELPPRALESDAAFALRDRRRRRSTERRPAGRDRLVLRARDRRSEHPPEFRRATANRRRRGADDGHDADAAHRRCRVAAAFQPADGTRDAAQHRGRRHAEVVGGRPSVRARVATIARSAADRDCRPTSPRLRDRAACPSREAPTTSAMCRGSCRPQLSRIRRTSPA